MILRGKKVRLRPIRMSDAPRFVKWLSNSEINKFLTTRPITLRQERTWIRSLPKRKDHKNFAIDAFDGSHIGSCGFTTIDTRSKRATLGIMIGDKRYWDKGYGTDAMRVLLRYGFKNLRLHRIYLSIVSYNPRAQRVYRRLGFVKEGVAREDWYYRGKYYDVWSMGILRKEWAQLQ